MGTTPPRRLVLVPASPALIPTGAVAPAAARTSCSGVPAALSYRAPAPSTAVVTPLGVATTAAGGVRHACVTARGRRPRRTDTGHPGP